MNRILFAAAAFAAAFAVEAATPKVMVVVDEKALGTISTSEIEAMAVKMLADKGVETVDPSMVKSNIERIKSAFKGAGDNRAAAVMGREFGADVMLVGEAVSKPNAAKIGDSNLRSYMATVTLRAVRVDDSVNIASSSETASAVSIDDVTGSSKALKLAGGKALKSIIPALVSKWDGQGSGGSGRAGRENRADGAAIGRTSIEITVGGMDQMWKLKETRLRLKGMENEIASVTQKSYAQGMAVFRVESLVPAEELAEALVINPPEDLRIQVVEIKPNVMELRVVEAPEEDDDE